MNGDAMSASIDTNLSCFRNAWSPDIARVPKQRDLIKVDAKFGHSVHGARPLTHHSKLAVSVLPAGDNFCLVKLGCLGNGFTFSESRSEIRQALSRCGV